MPWIDQTEAVPTPRMGSGNGRPVGHPRRVVQFEIAGFETQFVIELTY